MIRVDKNYSSKVLLRLLVSAVLAGLGLFLVRGFIIDFYFQNQLTHAGLVLNAAIMLLFLMGMYRVTVNLMHYAREERWLSRFVAHLDDGGVKPVKSVSQNSIIYQRYSAIQRIAQQQAPINHNALASMLLASESVRLSFPRFINNILILSGVFGTIVSLSIALLGASDLLGSIQSMGNMNLVIHGMATALSTTMTAILCYVFYGYFYLKMTDAQTQLLGGVEQVTSLYLMPQFTHHPEGMLTRVAALVKSLGDTAQRMHLAQGAYANAGEQLRETVAGLGRSLRALTEDVEQIKHYLREGFRLSGN